MDSAVRALIEALPFRPLVRPKTLLPPIILRVWRWRPLKPYNGFSHSERVLNWQVSDWLRCAGALLAPDVCDLCRASAPLSLHAEDYTDPERAMFLCQDCHFAVHRRFSVPAALAERARAPGAAPPWIAALPSTPTDVATQLRRAGYPELLDRLPLWCEPLVTHFRSDHRGKGDGGSNLVEQ